jgi:hypothetical protein
MKFLLPVILFCGLSSAFVILPSGAVVPEEQSEIDDIEAFEEALEVADELGVDPRELGIDERQGFLGSLVRGASTVLSGAAAGALQGALGGALGALGRR